MATTNWEERIKKAEEAALKKAQKDGLDEEATAKAVEEAVAKVKDAQKKAEGKATAKAQAWIVKVSNNPNFVGIGAGGIQFANGQARVTSARMASWFMEHPGYDVEEVTE